MVTKCLNILRGIIRLSRALTITHVRGIITWIIIEYDTIGRRRPLFMHIEHHSKRFWYECYNHGWLLLSYIISSCGIFLGRDWTLKTLDIPLHDKILKYPNRYTSSLEAKIAHHYVGRGSYWDIQISYFWLCNVIAIHQIWTRYTQHL